MSTWRLHILSSRGSTYFSAVVANEIPKVSRVCTHIRCSPVLYLLHVRDMNATVVSTWALDIRWLTSEWFLGISLATTRHWYMIVVFFLIFLIICLSVVNFFRSRRGSPQRAANAVVVAECVPTFCEGNRIREEQAWPVYVAGHLGRPLWRLVWLVDAGCNMEYQWLLLIWCHCF